MNDFYLDQISEILSFAGRSENTITSYKTYVSPFLDYCVDVLRKDPAEVSSAEIRSYITDIRQERGLSDATVNHILSELRFFYESVLGLGWNSKQLPHRKIRRCLPYVPDRDTVSTFLCSIDDKKKKAMVSLLYSSGLRISEVCRLKCADIYHSSSRIYVAPSKNGKDRYTILAFTPASNEKPRLALYTAARCFKTDLPAVHPELYQAAAGCTWVGLSADGAFLPVRICKPQL